MNAKELLGAGKVRDAESALNAYLRNNPADAGQRTFLFELLCFSGQYDRAEKHLGVLAKEGPGSRDGRGALLLRPACRKDAA